MLEFDLEFVVTIPEVNTNRRSKYSSNVSYATLHNPLSSINQSQHPKANPKLCLTGEMHSLNNSLHMAIMHYDGNLRIIEIILDRIGTGINKAIWDRYGKRVTPLDMLFVIIMQ